MLAKSTHTFNPSSSTNWHRNWTVNAFNTRTRKDYKTGGENSETVLFWDSWGQDHPFWTEVEVRASSWLLCFWDLQIPGSRIDISDWHRGKNQWLAIFAYLVFRLSPDISEFLLIVLQEAVIWRMEE